MYFEFRAFDCYPILSRVGCPAGLSVAQSDRVTGKQPLKGDMLAS
jgi:hypothetical protein